MRVVVRRVVPLLAIAAVAVAAACEPVKKHPLKDTPPGQNIAFYATIDGFEPDGSNLTQSPSPFTAPVCGATGQASQTLNADGSVTLSVVLPGAGACSHGVSGFGVVGGPLADVTNSAIGTTPGSSPVGFLFAFDVDRDGAFGGEFNPNGTGAGFGSDVMCGIAPVPRTLAPPVAALDSGIDDVTPLRCVGQAGAETGNRTLSALRGGATIGSSRIGRNTPTAIVVAMSARTDRVSPAAVGDDITSATVTSVTINGVEQL